jgi:hypothetical protein
MLPVSMLLGLGFIFSCMVRERKSIVRYDTLTDYDKISPGRIKSRYYYIGDIDYEGIGIFNELIEQNPALHIKLMTPLYIMMLEKSRGSIPASYKDMQMESNLEGFLAEF